MRPIFLFLLSFISISFISKAQNIQLHYDFGHNIYDKDLSSRPKLTSTIDMFHLDKYGSTFFFVDMDYKSDGVKNAYWEIVRELKFWNNPFSLHLEYNGGLSNNFSYNNSYLLGGTYTWNNHSFTKGFSLSAMYKYIQKNKKPNSFQITGTWYLNFTDNQLFTFIGFADLWKEKSPHGNYIFISEPQIWFNLYRLQKINKNIKLSIGSEVELSYNFANRNGFYGIPTLALKWTFN